MQTKYTVHSASQTPFQVEASYGGQTISATVTGLIIELISEGGDMTHTLKLMPGADLDYALANFVVGAEVTGTFALTVAA